MTEFEVLTLMIAFGTFVAAIILGLVQIIIAILNLLKKK